LKIVSPSIGSGGQRDGKRFMDYDIMAMLKEKGNENILDQLAARVKPTDRKRGKLHEVFETSLISKNLLVLNL